MIESGPEITKKNAEVIVVEDELDGAEQAAQP